MTGGGSASELSWFCDWAGSDLGNDDEATLGSNSTGTCFDGHTSNHNGPSSLNSLEIGNNCANDPGVGDPATPQYWYIGGVAVRVSANGNDWIGPYPAPGTGEGA